MLAGDDWGFYDSVVLTIIHGRPVVSDWLSPSTVGLSIPAAWLSLVVGNVWLGSMAVVGVFGTLGLAGFWSLLRSLNIAPNHIALALLVLGFFPIYLGKWSRFESSVPALSLLLVALALLVRSFLSFPKGQRRSFLYLFAASVCIAWAITIRQNHWVAVVVGAAGVWLIPPPKYRVIRLAIWMSAPVVALGYLRVGVEPSFSQSTATYFKLIETFSVARNLTTLVRGLFFSAGVAFLMLVLVSPGAAIEQLRGLSRLRWSMGAVGLAGLVIYLVLSQQSLRWLAPATDVFLLSRSTPVMIATVVLGSLVWCSFLPGRATSGRLWMHQGLLLMSGGYLVLMAGWGYWEYYALEPIVLLFVTALPVGQRPSCIDSRFGRATVLIGLLVYAAVSWYGQRVSNDLQTAQLQIIESAFRDGTTRPGDIGGAPFGLAAWNVFPYQVRQWQTQRTGNPLAFWELLSKSPAFVFRWRCSNDRVVSKDDRVVRAGIARIGFRDQCWILLQKLQAEGDPRLLSIPHRYLPLTSAEWQSYLAHGGQ
jgi:hypothetical protein